MSNTLILNNSLRSVEIFSVWLQYVVAKIFLPITYSVCVFVMRFGARYRIENVGGVRAEYSKLISEHDGPLLICANHLTKIDSLIIHWALGTLWTYLKNFNRFAWNLPERERYQDNLILRCICYVGCCIPVDRGGARDKVKNSLDRLKLLLNKNGTATIFPEGKRSLTGRVDIENYAYGIGKLADSIDNCKILCVYLRGEKQAEKSDAPKTNQNFFIRLKSISPESENRGMLRSRDIATQVITELASMENDYFAARK